MSILVTYKSALELLRLPEFPRLVATWDERTGHVPELLPFQMARVCNELEEALLISELCGTYAIAANDDGMAR